jgi:hypothetical protein
VHAQHICSVDRRDLEAEVADILGDTTPFEHQQARPRLDRELSLTG